jgi:mRNA interferase MazF
MTCRRGEIVLVLFPDSNLRTSKRRPALIVQADGLGTALPQVVVAMITSNMARAGHPSRVIVRADDQATEGSGLLMDSVIMTDNLATKADEAGTLRTQSAERVRQAVVKALRQIHAVLNADQRLPLAYLIRTGALTV